MSFLGNIFGSKRDTEVSAELDAKLATLNHQDYAPGGRIYNDLLRTKSKAAADKAYDDVRGHLSEAAAQTARIDAEYVEAFDEGLQEGYDNVTGGIKSTLKFPFKFAWDAIPWQVWLTGAAVLFFYLGGWKWIKRFK